MFNPIMELKEKIKAEGGFVNAHAHFDRAYSVTHGDLVAAEERVNSHLHEKWKLVDKFKASQSEDDSFRHITAALRAQKEFGTSTVLSFIDSDPVAGDRALKAAKRAQEYASQELKMRFVLACQTLKGVVSKEARQYFEASLDYVDIIGGLPGADVGAEAQHLDILLQAGRDLGKRVHVHVDQLNAATEKETELLARKTIEWGMEGKVTAVHGISIAAHPRSYRQEVYRMCVEAGLSFISCPTAWIDSRRTETLSPTHNAVTPIDEMLPLGIKVAIGSDNVADLYKPFSNGDMFTELRVLLESTHFYDVPELVKVATEYGRHVIFGD